MAIPSNADLRRASTEAHVAAFRRDAEARIGRTWRGRLAWKLAGWIARLTR
jgi:hypothetical protein